jgi:hypothetical protein
MLARSNNPSNLLTSSLLVLIFLATGPAALGGNVKLAWDPNTEYGLAGYKLVYRTASGGYGAPVDVGNTTTYTVTGLAAGTYFFALKAYNTGGLESTFCPEVSTTVVAIDSMPPIISNVTATPITQSALSINWTTNEPSDTQVEYGATLAYGNTVSLASALVTSHSVQLTGLQPGATYHFRVKSRDAPGNLAVSADSTAQTLLIPAPGTVNLK